MKWGHWGSGLSSDGDGYSDYEELYIFGTNPTTTFRAPRILAALGNPAFPQQRERELEALPL